MKTKKFNTYSNNYTVFTPIDEQICIWLENNPNITLDSVEISLKEALVYYNEIES